MARKSTSSSTTAANGQAVTPSVAEDTAPTADVRTKLPSNGPRAATVDFDDWEPTDTTRGKPMPCDASLYPTGSRSQTAIGEQAFFLGFASATSLLALLALTLLSPHPLWRLPAFTACLSLFHFLEYETTARYNLPALRASSFLLFTNGQAYNVAYGLALVETVAATFLPAYRAWGVSAGTVGLGLALVAVGQAVRSTAMVQAGTNFNHTPANTKREGHELVTRGVYGWLRHPSYFGFFWWAIGTQLLIGNKVCLVGYVLVLWRFFKHRIVAEEKKLVEFFGTDYEVFRRKTRTGIPFIR